MVTLPSLTRGSEAAYTPSVMPLQHGSLRDRRREMTRDQRMNVDARLVLRE